MSCNSPWKCPPFKCKTRQKAGFPFVTYTTCYSQFFIAFAFSAKRFAIAILVLFASRIFSRRTAKSFLANVLRVDIKKACDQDLTHSLDTPNNVFIKILTRDAGGTWHALCTSTSTHSIQQKHKKQPETRKRK